MKVGRDQGRAGFILLKNFKLIKADDGDGSDITMMELMFDSKSHVQMSVNKLLGKSVGHFFH
jgi:hypothetical protein